MDFTPIWNAFFETLTEALVILLASLGALAIGELRKWLKAKAGEQQTDLIFQLIDNVVEGVAQEFRSAGNQVKFEAALERARLALAEKGLNVDPMLLRTWIEKAYANWKESQAYAEETQARLAKVQAETAQTEPSTALTDAALPAAQDAALLGQ